MTLKQGNSEVKTKFKKKQNLPASLSYMVDNDQ